MRIFYDLGLVINQNENIFKSIAYSYFLPYLQYGKKYINYNKIHKLILMILLCILTTKIRRIL